MIELYAYEAGTGDFLRLRFRSAEETKSHNIIIDSGKKLNVAEKKRGRDSFEKIVNEIASSDDDTIDAIFITHWDADHIDGFECGMQQFSKETIEKLGSVYMNSGIVYAQTIVEDTPQHSAEQAKKVAEFLFEKGIDWKDGLTQEMQLRKGKNPLIEVGGAKLWLISPGEKQLEALKDADARVAEFIEARKQAEHAAALIIPGSFSDELLLQVKEDKSSANGSSIAFLFEYEGFRMAFLGDAHPSVCAKGLRMLGYTNENPCRVDLIKVPHHGSTHNYSEELYNLLLSDRILISTNGPVNSGNLLPNKSFISKVLLNHPHKNRKMTIYCNYSWWEEKKHRDNYFVKDKSQQSEIKNNGAELHIKTKYQEEEYTLELININESNLLEGRLSYPLTDK